MHNSPNKAQSNGLLCVGTMSVGAPPRDLPGGSRIVAVLLLAARLQLFCIGDSLCSASKGSSCSYVLHMLTETVVLCVKRVAPRWAAKMLERMTSTSLRLVL